MAEIFISYKKEDRVVAERLVTALRDAGKSVWWDDALNPAQAWDAMIEREIAAAKVVIVLWTPRSVQSDWVRSEAHYAQDHHKLIPVMIEACTLPMAFMLRQAVDLSSGEFAGDNPQWGKLLGWIDAVETHDSDALPEPSGEVAAAAAVPIKALAKESWLGPTRRPAMGFALIGLLLVAAVGLFLMRGALGIGKGPQPDVVIDPFMVRAAGLPADFAQSLSNEMFSGFSTSSRISPVSGDGKRRLQAYQLTGDVSAEGDRLLVIAKLFVPGAEAPVATIKLSQPKTSTIPARLFGLSLAEFTRCVATASDSIGSKLHVLPTEAMSPWAKFCMQNNSGTEATTAEAMVANLRNVVAADPGFANGWANLSENLWNSAFSPGADKVALLEEAGKAADRALKIEPTTAKAYAIKARLVLGINGDPKSNSLLGRMHGFAESDELSQKSISVRPSDCGCELPQYANLLTLFGRLSAATPYAQQAVGNDSTQYYHAIPLANLVASTGNPAGGARMLDDLAKAWPGTTEIDMARFQQALWRRDWAGARTALTALPDGPGKTAYPALLDALEGGDPARIRAAGAPFLAQTSNPQTTTQLGLWGLALAGYDDQAVDALEAAMRVNSMYMFTVAYRSPFGNARKTAKFAALATRMGLIDYWKMPGHRPDFCSEPSPAALCATVSKT